MSAFLSRPVVHGMLLVALRAVTGPAQSAASGPGPALPAQLSASARAAIERTIDSARAVGIPTTPLVAKAAEGVLKGADDQRIIIAVQSLTRELGAARFILGGTNNAPLIGAAASALHAGVDAADLRRLAHPAGQDPSDPNTLESALVTLVDLVAKHISPPLAASSIEELLRRRAAEARFAALRNDVEQAIRSGQSPEAALAAQVRVQEHILDAPSPPGQTVPHKPPS